MHNANGSQASLPAISPYAPARNAEAAALPGARDASAWTTFEPWSGLNLQRPRTETAAMTQLTTASFSMRALASGRDVAPGAAQIRFHSSLDGLSTTGLAHFSLPQTCVRAAKRQCGARLAGAATDGSCERESSQGPVPDCRRLPGRGTTIRARNARATVSRLPAPAQVRRAAVPP